MEWPRTRLRDVAQEFICGGTPRTKIERYWAGNLPYRDRDEVEVDIVIERGAMAVAGVEIKAGATVTQADFRGLRKPKAVLGNRFTGGVVVYNGEMCTRFGDRLYAVPIRLLRDTLANSG